MYNLHRSKIAIFSQTGDQISFSSQFFFIGIGIDRSTPVHYLCDILCRYVIRINYKLSEIIMTIILKRVFIETIIYNILYVIRVCTNHIR